MFDIKEELKKLPDRPGVYIMRDRSGTIIYIGKAISLKNRVRSYFAQSHADSAKTRALVSNIFQFEYIITGTEVEALLLECTMIKKHRPKFNILLKDDKSFPYIKVTLNETFPRVLMVRKVEKDGARYFGPFTSAFSVRESIALIKKVFPLKTCEKVLPKEEGCERACLNFHIYQCLGPCIPGQVSKEDYAKMVADICAVLDGKYDFLERQLESEMIEASSAMEFEKAASFRDKLMNLKAAKAKQNFVTNSGEDQDVFAFSRNNIDACMQTFWIRDGRITGRESFMIVGSMNSSDSEIVGEFLKQYYNVAQFVPPEITVPCEFEEHNVVEEWLSGVRGRKVNIVIPQRGVRMKLLEMVRENASATLARFNENKIKEEASAREGLEALRLALGMAGFAHRIEAFDVSNTGESENVASMVTYVEGRPLKKEYRRFKIKTVEGANDYASMQEAVFRRMKKAELADNYPDLILVDGGTGHISSVFEVLNSMGLEIPIAGLVKDERHRARGLMRFDGVEVGFEKNMPLLRFISGIQDEAHRFAIEYNRKLRGMRYRTSVLDNIVGIGDKRKKALLSHFGGIEKIRAATIDELCAVEGVNRSTAEKIARYLKGGIA
ncbi:MAG: excinuclease ABC subunit UvrC [Bacillota bacterium]